MRCSSMSLGASKAPHSESREGLCREHPGGLRDALGRGGDGGSQRTLMRSSHGFAMSRATRSAPTGETAHSTDARHEHEQARGFRG